MPKRKNETPLTKSSKDGVEVYSPEEEKFCQNYVELFGNGTKAMQLAYGTDEKPISYNTAGVMANEYLKKPKILKRIREILDLSELNEETVDVELNFIIKQQADLSAKRGGIDIFNKMMGRYEKDNKQKQPIIQMVAYGEQDNDSVQLQPKSLPASTS